MYQNVIHVSIKKKQVRFNTLPFSGKMTSRLFLTVQLRESNEKHIWINKSQMYSQEGSLSNILCPIFGKKDVFVRQHQQTGTQSTRLYSDCHMP